MCWTLLNLEHFAIAGDNLKLNKLPTFSSIWRRTQFFFFLFQSVQIYDFATVADIMVISPCHPAVMLSYGGYMTAAAARRLSAWGWSCNKPEETPLLLLQYPERGTERTVRTSARSNLTDWIPSRVAAPGRCQRSGGKTWSTCLIFWLELFLLSIESPQKIQETYRLNFASPCP